MNDAALGRELIARAEAMIPTLRERAPQDDKNGFTSKDTFREFREAGFTRIAQPKRYGGLELPLSVLAQVEIAIATGDQSAAWSYAVTQGHAHHLSMFDDRAQKDVWGDNPDTLIASPYNPMGQASTTDGGYHFKGRWRYSSGCDHCDWFLLGGFVDGDESRFCTFLVPRTEVQIVDDWDVFGLKGTGSKSVVVEGTFVPEYRVVPFGPGTEDFDFPGFAVNRAPALRIPYILVFNRSITATSIGGLAGLIDEMVEYLAPKVSIVSGKPLSTHPDTLLALGQAKATLEELKILAVHDLDALEAMAAAGNIPGEEEINLYRYRAQETSARCADAARALFEESGGGGMYENMPIGRIYRNIVAARNHPAAAMWKESARAIGTNLFGGIAEKRRRF
ncbi:MAG: flavin-dependent monooxygenase [Porticoccaceae bacterium]|nr:flavin-dependent monooxygenase [Porticoccaceae bacterium]